MSYRPIQHRVHFCPDRLLSAVRQKHSAWIPKRYGKMGGWTGRGPVAGWAGHGDGNLQGLDCGRSGGVKGLELKQDFRGVHGSGRAANGQADSSRAVPTFAVPAG